MHVVCNESKLVGSLLARNLKIPYSMQKTTLLLAESCGTVRATALVL